MTTSKTALVTGATGLLGRQVDSVFRRAGWKTVGTGFSRAKPPDVVKLDLCDGAAVERVLKDVKPDAVIHCAAQRAPDAVSANPDAARELNVSSVETLARLTSSSKIFLLYISTDYVFSGAPGQAPYTPTSTASPTNLYGQTKLDGENVLLSTCSPGDGVVLRVPVLYGPTEGQGKEGRAESAVNCLVDKVYEAQEKEVGMDDWSIRYPTHIEDVARVCRDVASIYVRSLQGDGGKSDRLPRILQFSSEDRMTKYQICEILAEILGLPMAKMVANKQGNDPNAAVQRPYDCRMSTDALQELRISVETQSFAAWWRWELGAVRK